MLSSQVRNLRENSERWLWQDLNQKILDFSWEGEKQAISVFQETRRKVRENKTNKVFAKTTKKTAEDMKNSLGISGMKVCMDNNNIQKSHVDILTHVF